MPNLSATEIIERKGYISGLIRKRPEFSIIIPTLNEDPHIAHALTHIRDTAHDGSTEIIVVDGKSTDQTQIIAQHFADKILISDHACRACQMHQGAKAAKGDILVFLHADTQLPRTWQKTLRSAWKNKKGKPAVTAFSPKFDMDTFFFRTLAKWTKWRTRWITGVPHGDQALAAERLPYLASGGFPHTPLMEEYYLVRKLRLRGPVKILPEKAITSSRRYQKNGPIVNNLRNLCILLLFYIGVSPNLLSRLYR